MRAGSDDSLPFHPGEQFFCQPRFADASFTTQDEHVRASRHHVAPGRLQLFPFPLSPNQGSDCGQGHTGLLRFLRLYLSLLLQEALIGLTRGPDRLGSQFALEDRGAGVVGA